MKEARNMKRSFVWKEREKDAHFFLFCKTVPLLPEWAPCFAKASCRNSPNWFFSSGW
jgi:hypothetical protein